MGKLSLVHPGGRRTGGGIEKGGGGGGGGGGTMSWAKKIKAGGREAPALIFAAMGFARFVTLIST